ncbi:prepilin-type N-terminal cleavage/methylation domain-containing protein [Pseudoduganella sp. LjRoot289]|uniref:type IV pilus modification PilV family protein n=1 Tax=Pseudoduganella sp. LjRoot289 TaxID=3342314 RepID=UPI003ED14BFC
MTIHPIPRPGLRPGPRSQQGIAMLEAMIAIVILAIGLLGTVGLQARSYSALSDASMRAEATMAAEKLLGLMSNDVANINSYALTESGTGSTAVAPWLAETKAQMPGALVSVRLTPQTARTMVVITIRWTRKTGSAENRHVLTSYVAGATAVGF